LMASGNPNIILGDSVGDKVLINGDGTSYFNGGSVGIGTDNVSQKLEIYDGNVSLYALTSGQSIRVRTNNGTIGELAQISGDGTLRLYTNESTPILRTQISSYGNTYINPNGGNVGIGTDNPTAPVHFYRDALTSDSTRFNLLLQDSSSYAEGVGGGINFGFKYDSAGNLINRSACIAGIKENGTDGNYASALTFHTTQNAASTSEKMRITSSGNVGIGLTNPSAKLDINGSDNTFIRLHNTSTGRQGIQWWNTYGGVSRKRCDITWNEGNANWEFRHYRSDNQSTRPYANIDFYGGVVSPTSATEFTGNLLMRIHQDGNIGIGTNNPTRQLHVNSPSVDPYILVDGSGGNRDGGYKLNNGGGEVTVVRGDLGKNVYYHDTNVLMNQNVSGFNQLKGNVVLDSQLLLGNLNTSNPSSVVIYRFLGAKNLALASGGVLVSGQTDTISGIAARITTANNAGTFFYGPYGHIHPGTYTALFRMKVSSNASGSFNGYIDVTGNGVSDPQGQGTLRPRQKNVYPNIFTSSNKYQYVALDFDWISQASSPNYIELRYINYANITDVYIDHIIITHRLPLA